jgi:hypothetical protein
MISCSKGNNTKAKDYEVPEEVKRAFIEKKVDEELDKNRVATCEMPKEYKSGFKKIKEGFIGLFVKDRFNLVLSKEISDKVVVELKDSIYENLGFNPSEFWSLLKPQTAKELNKLLVNQFIKVDDKKFTEIRSMTAVAYLFYFQEVDRKKGYELYLKNQDIGITRIKIAYDESAKLDKRKKLSFCDKIEFASLDFTSKSNYLKPSDVKGRYICKRGNQKVTIEKYLGGRMIFDIDFPGLKLKHEVKVKNFTGEYYRKGVILSTDHADDKFDLKIQQRTKKVNGSVAKTYQDNTVHSISLNGYMGGFEINTPKLLRCKKIVKMSYMKTEEKSRK